MATFVSGGGPLYFPADMSLMENENENYDYIAWEFAKGYFTQDTTATKVQSQMDQYKYDMNVTPAATEWYTEVITLVGATEINTTRKFYGAGGANLYNVRLTLRGNFNVTSGVVLDGDITEANESYELIGKTPRTFNTSIKDISLDYFQFLDYLRKPNGNLADLLFSSDDKISAENSGNNTQQFRFRGFDGNDTITGSDRSDVISGDSGNDNINGKNGNDALDGGNGDDYIEGNNGVDKITGGDGNDRLLGGQGADIITGGNGNDQLNGGLESDEITGGAGADKFILSKGNDTVKDFNSKQGDMLQLAKGQSYTLKDAGLGLSIDIKTGNTLDGTTLLLGIQKSAFDLKSIVIV